MAKPLRAPEQPINMAHAITESLAAGRARRIRAARARQPAPTYQQIAVEVGCSVSTVYNILTGRTHSTASDV